MNENFKNQGTEAINGDAIIANAMSAVEMETVVTSGLSIVEFPLGNGQLSQSDFGSANTIYVIKYDFTLVGNISMQENCVLEFRGGSFLFGTLTPNFTKIVGNGHIFKNTFSFGNSGTSANYGLLANTVLLAEWFGVKPNSGDQTDNINKAIAACQSLKNAKTLLFAGGRYLISGVVNIGNGDNILNWDINIVGSGNNFGTGTDFHLAENAYFNVNLLNSGEGTHRGGGIYNCCFMDYFNSYKGNGIILQGVRTFTIYKCRFVYLNQAIKFGLDSYYNHVESCLFSFCCTSIIAEEAIGSDNEIHYANNNIVSGCWIDNSPTPLDLRGGHCNHVYDTDIENANGTILLGDYNRLGNVRIERNAEGTPWVEIGDYCIVDADICAAGGENITWRVIVNGDYNDLRVNFNGFHPYGFISYGKKNKFQIYTKMQETPDYHPVYMVYDPEDYLMINGRTNKQNYEGENIISYVDFTLQNNSPEVYRGQNCYPIVSNNNQNIAIRIPVDSENGLPIMPSYYLTCKFKITPSVSTGILNVNLLKGLGNGFTMDASKHNKWFGVVAAFEKNSVVGGGSINPDLIVLYRQEAGNNKIYLIDVVFSTTLLFERPTLAKSEGSTFCLTGTDGVIHLPKNKLNHVLSTFSMEMSTGQIYSNWLGKQFRYDSTKGKYYSDGYEVAAKTEQTISNFSGLIQGLTDVEVELCDVKTGEMLSFRAWRQSTTENFSWQVIATTGPNITAINLYGTVGVSGFTNFPTQWILLKPRQQGDIIYKNSQLKHVWWNGEAEVDL